MAHTDEFKHLERIAYFSMEIALQGDMPTYAGGLGILAGDCLRSAADLGIPFVGVTLASHKGYFRQTIENGRQCEHPDTWDIAARTSALEAKVSLLLEGRTVWVSAWLYVVDGFLGRQPVVLLDTALPENHPEDRALTDELYGGDERMRLKQEAVLGIGGVRMLQALGFRIRH